MLLGGQYVPTAQSAFWSGVAHAHPLGQSVSFTDPSGQNEPARHGATVVTFAQWLPAGQRPSVCASARVRSPPQYAPTEVQGRCICVVGQKNPAGQSRLTWHSDGVSWNAPSVQSPGGVHVNCESSAVGAQVVPLATKPPGLHPALQLLTAAITIGSFGTLHAVHPVVDGS